MNALELRWMPYRDPVVQGLVTALLTDLSERYGGGSGDDTPVGEDDFTPPNGGFVVAWLGGAPVGCGAWRATEHGPGAAEIKRMYVVPAARGRGVAMAVLRGLEDSARAAGQTRMILEAGSAQPEALALYEKAGYDRIENFGFYKDEPGVRSYGRTL